MNRSPIEGIPTGLRSLTNIVLTSDGIERVTNGTFTGAATGWTLASGWAYSSNTVIKNAAGTGALEQNIGAQAYELYLLTATISNWTAGTTLTPSIGGVDSPAITGNISYSEYIATTAVGNLKFTPTTDVRCTIDGVSSKLISSTIMVDSTGAITGWVSSDGIIAYQNGLYTYRRGGNLADDGTFTLPIIPNGGYGHMVAGADEERATFTIKSDGTVNLIVGSANVVANADTDTKVCIGTSVSSPAIIKQRLGGTKAISFNLTYN